MKSFSRWPRPRLEYRVLLLLRVLLILAAFLLVAGVYFNVWETVSLAASRMNTRVRVRESWPVWRLRDDPAPALGTVSAASTPRIVLWTHFYDFYDYSGTGVRPGLWDECAGELVGMKCDIVYVNKTEELRDDDAIVFHVRNLEWHELPKRRHPDQLWIFFVIESPEYSGMPGNHLEKYGHMFNWTFTYRQDSDVPYPYGVVTKRLGADPSPVGAPAGDGDTRLRAVISNKTRLAAITVTHCNTRSRRESLIRTLQHYVDVDVFGRCSVNVTCGPEDGIGVCTTMECKFAHFSVCYETLARSHKFYLSFENSLCVDYVTEKFFMALQYDIVPIVYGGMAANYVGIAPPGSYINARDFESPKELAEHLQWLDTNPEEYLKYFRWKDEYEVSVSKAVGWCALCRKLRQRRTQPQPQRQSYEDIRAWWISTPTAGVRAGTAGAKTKPGPACEPKPKFEYEGWEDKKFNYQYR